MATFAIMLVPFVLVLSFGIYMVKWQFRTAAARVQTWVERSGFVLLELHEANPLGTGPMARSGNKQVMYRVLITTADGHRRRALVKVGSPGMGVLSSDFVVEWDDAGTTLA